MTDPLAVAPPAALALPREPALSWGAIWAGAAVAVASSLILTLAASGVGYETGFPGLASRASLKAFAPEVGAAAMAIQVLSAALGGYVAGRTRTIWSGLHDDESHFRDTAHGLIAWAVASIGGVLLATVVLAPYADALAAAAPATAAPSQADAERAGHVAAQASLFLAIGMLLSAFASAVAARIGGMRHEAMHARGRA